MHPRWTRRFLAPGAAIAALVALAACSQGANGSGQTLVWDTAAGCPPAAGGAVTLAVGARANSSQPQVPGAVNDLVAAAAKAGAPVQVVRVDGAPSTAFSATFQYTAANDVARQQELDNFLSATNAEISGLTPKAPEADVLGALDEAARLTPAGGFVVLIDSGLQTKGLIQFQNAGMFDADPAEVASFVGDNGALPDLAGKSVVFVGLGNTAEPQPSLTNPDLRRKVTALWTTIAQQAGAACIATVATPESRSSVTTDLAVTVVPLPVVAPFNPCGATVLRDDGAVGFVPDSTQFRDPNAARSTLQPYADWLRDNAGAHADLVGYIAHYGDRNSSLSLHRAQAVRDTLIQLGADGGRITASGGGWGPYPDPNAPPDPAVDQRNRMVVVTISCT